MIMELTKNILKATSINNLNWPGAGLFKNRLIDETCQRRWLRQSVLCYDLQCMFIGKTGYGKSSTLNRIVGDNVFETDDINACTANLYCADYILNADRHYFLSLCDLPGVGEDEDRDAGYLAWYQQMLIKSDCVVYVLRADQRDMSVDLKVFRILQIRPDNCVIALNYCDKIEPVSRCSVLPTNEQRCNINLKIRDISRTFNFPVTQILPYSAYTGWNIGALLYAMSGKLSCGFRT